MVSSPVALQQINRNQALRALAMDVAALAFIYFIPAFSHMIGLKLYLIEPMRMMLILALVHTHRRNAFLLALTLPLFSFLISSHPVLLKTGLISFELMLNVGLFYFLIRRIHTLGAIFASIWISKLVYYGLKYIAVLTIWQGDSLISTPLYIQLITSSVFSIYLFLVYKNSSE
ncbi:MAG: hypothetical protein R6U64_05030 [Bacteroidales bacterium]